MGGGPMQIRLDVLPEFSTILDRLDRLEGRLREEAAGAVREALRDLRSAVADGPKKGQANA